MAKTQNIVTFCGMSLPKKNTLSNASYVADFVSPLFQVGNMKNPADKIVPTRNVLPVFLCVFFVLSKRIYFRVRVFFYKRIGIRQNFISLREKESFLKKSHGL